jgi:hypothetical protein
MIDINNIGVVLQGPLYNDDFTNKIIEKYSCIKNNCVISTWSNENYSLIQKLNSCGFKVLVDDQPEFTGNHNCNLQTKSSINGINYLSGFSHILRMRTDLIPNDVIKFVDVLSKITKDKIILLCWIDGSDINYFADFFTFGPIDSSKRFWNVQQDKSESEMFTEQYLCYKYTGIKYPKYLDIKDLFSFSINELHNENIELNWIKPGRDWGDHIKRYMFSTNNDIFKFYVNEP